MTNLLIIVLLLILIISIVFNTFFTKRCVNVNNKVLENDNYRTKIFKKVNSESELSKDQQLREMNLALTSDRCATLFEKRRLCKKRYTIGAMVYYYMNNYKYNVPQRFYGIVLKDCNMGVKIFSKIENNPKFFIISKQNVEEEIPINKMNEMESRFLNDFNKNYFFDREDGTLRMK